MLEFTVGGIDYLVDVDLEDKMITAVHSVEIWDGENYRLIEMDDEQLSDFFDTYRDNMNDAYDNYLQALEDEYYEDNFEIEREMRVFGE
jgi:hypothetical protein